MRRRQRWTWHRGCARCGVPVSGPAFIPGLGELEREFADLWRAADKIVFSSTLTQTSTSRTRIERAFDPDHIRQLKATSERDITVGGPHLAAAMIAADVVDEIHALVHPIIVGGGNYWLPRDVRIPLELVTERRLGSVVYMKYGRGPTGSAAPRARARASVRENFV